MPHDLWSLFQSTRPRGRTRRSALRLWRCLPVSIHASSREDATGDVTALIFILKFQSTRPRGRTRLPVYAREFILSSFNPRVLAGGRDKCHFRETDAGAVSIHASSREDATADSTQDAVDFSFQSTRPRGRTRPGESVTNEDGTVSIHASSREDATFRLKRKNLSSGFNPRVLAGGRDFG